MQLVLGSNCQGKLWILHLLIYLEGRLLLREPSMKIMAKSIRKLSESFSPETLWICGWRELKVWAKDKHLQQSRSRQATGNEIVTLFLQQFSNPNKQLRSSHFALSPQTMHSHLGQPLESRCWLLQEGIFMPPRVGLGEASRLCVLSRMRVQGLPKACFGKMSPLTASGKEA